MNPRAFHAVLLVMVLGLPRAKSAEIASLEYFIDADPGIGDGMILSNAPADEVSVDVTVALDGLDAGMHVLYVRAFASDGLSSQLAARPFAVVRDPATPVQIAQLEYSVDSGAQAGGAQTLVFSMGDEVRLDSLIPLSGVADGASVLTVRAVDDHGRSGIPASRMVVKTSSILEPPPFLDRVNYRIVPDLGGDPVIDQDLLVGDQAMLDQQLEDALNGLVRGESYRLMVQATDADGDQGAPIQQAFRFVCLEDLWAEQFFSTEDLMDPQVSGPDADPNQNGIPNRIEVALATDPLSSEPGWTPQAPPGNGETFRLRGRSWQGGTGTPLLDYRVNGYRVRSEVATDLEAGDWVEASTVLEATVQPSATHFFVDDIELRVTDDAAAASVRYFFRMVVESPLECAPFALFEQP